MPARSDAQPPDSSTHPPMLNSYEEKLVREELRVIGEEQLEKGARLADGIAPMGVCEVCAGTCMTMAPLYQMGTGYPVLTDGAKTMRVESVPCPLCS
jgi:hypothetical protein